VEFALATLAKVSSAQPALTVIANAGVHRIPTRYLRGEVFEASHGDLDLRTQEAATKSIATILVGLSGKLREKEWSEIYLVPTGHPVVTAQIKTMIYRILRKNTVDLLYVGGRYFDIDIDQRKLAIDHDPTVEMAASRGRSKRATTRTRTKSKQT
jgi:hypothetical protein